MSQFDKWLLISGTARQDTLLALNLKFDEICKNELMMMYISKTALSTILNVRKNSIQALEHFLTIYFVFDIAVFEVQANHLIHVSQKQMNAFLDG